MAVLVALAVVLLVPLAGWLSYLDHELDEIPDFPAGLERVDSPPRVEDHGDNILLVGADNPDGDVVRALERRTWAAGQFRTDTIMLLHVAGDRRSAQLISIPRDSWVSIPGHGRGKINAAFSYGGPTLLVETIEDFTGVRVDHMMVVGLFGFADITDAIGGVDLPVRGTTQHLRGASALEYVRERKTLPDGDFSRIERQQNFMRAVLHQVMTPDVILDPVKLTTLISDLSNYVAVDETFSGKAIRDLAFSTRRMRPGDITFATIPTLGYGRSPDGQSYVVVDQPTVADLFHDVVRDNFDVWASKHEVSTLPAATAVR